MLRPAHRRRRCTAAFAAVFVALAVTAASAQTPTAPPSTKHAREADDAYLAGANKLAANDPAAAQKDFSRAVALDPTRAEYATALAVAKEHYVTQLVQNGAKARLLHHDAEADNLFAEAHKLDPDNTLVAQHLDAPALLLITAPPPPVGADDIARLGGALHLQPTVGTHTFHVRGDTQTALRDVYSNFGIQVTFDPSVTTQPVRFDLEDADYATATRIILMMTHTFPVPLSGKSVLLAKETPENRTNLSQQIEETVYLPGLPTEQLTELSNVAKNIFDLKQVSIAQSGSALILRGDDDALQLVNTTFADILDGGSDVMIEVKLYEVSKTFTRNLGTTLPTSAGAFIIPALATQLVAANQALIQQAVAAGLDITTGTYYQILARELIFLAGAGVSIPQFSNLLGTIGTIGAAAGVAGIPLAGVFLGSGTSFNALLNSTDVRTLDAVQLRVSDRQLGTFRSGTRYPITTATYSSGLSAAQTSAVSGLKINGTSVGSLLNSLQTATVPQFQYEDLGLTLKATPQVLKSGRVSVHLDMKIEALGGGVINSIPILNSRQLTSDITVPDGETAMLTSEVSEQESRAVQGIPLLNEIPGFAGTNGNVEHDNSDLLITITPHVIRKRSPVKSTRRVLANLAPTPE